MFKVFKRKAGSIFKQTPFGNFQALYILCIASRKYIFLRILHTDLIVIDFIVKFEILYFSKKDEKLLILVKGRKDLPAHKRKNRPVVSHTSYLLTF